MYEVINQSFVQAWLTDLSLLSVSPSLITVPMVTNTVCFISVLVLSPPSSIHWFVLLLCSPVPFPLWLFYAFKPCVSLFICKVLPSEIFIPILGCLCFLFGPWPVLFFFGHGLSYASPVCLTSAMNNIHDYLINPNQASTEFRHSRPTKQCSQLLHWCSQSRILSFITHIKAIIKKCKPQC